MKTVRVIRPVHHDEPHNYSGLDVNEGTVLYVFEHCTYGAVDEVNGVALTGKSNGDYPFFEFPRDAVSFDPITKAYRLFRIGKNGQPNTLFHPYYSVLSGRTRQFALDIWEQAEEKQVWNPGKKNAGPGYISGFHCFLNEADAVKCLTYFKNKDDLRIVPVTVEGIRPKPRGRNNAMLAKLMYLHWEDWYCAVDGKAYV